MPHTWMARITAGLVATVTLIGGSTVAWSAAGSPPSRSRPWAATASGTRHADGRRLVLAFSYPWFGPSSYDDSRLADAPLTPWNMWDQADAVAQLAQARAGGIDGFIQSWSGADHDGAQLDVALAAAQAAGAPAGVLLETSIANTDRSAGKPADASVVAAWLDEALAKASSPAFLRAGGVPVVFAFDMGRLPAADWKRILSTRSVRVVGDTIAYRDVLWGYYRYNPNFIDGTVADSTRLASWNQQAAADVRSGTTPKLFAATVSPGWDDRNLRGSDRTVVPRGDTGAHYQQTWDAALSADPDWVLVTSWNEWYEGTAVQPSKQYGSGALAQTEANRQRFTVRPLTASVRARMRGAWAH